MPSAYPLKVFISYASSDREVAHKLYNWLSGKGFDPWLDTENLLPGVEWELEIARAIESAEAIIVCLSTLSITKDGYVQKEIKDALNAASRKPEGTIFLIPARIEECEVPYSLKRYQWVDLYSAHGFCKLEKALEARRQDVSISKQRYISRIGLPYSKTCSTDTSLIHTGRVSAVDRFLPPGLRSLEV